jgi:hypothetical protein
MKENIRFLFILLILLAVVKNYSQTIDWERDLYSNQGLAINCITSDASGNIYEAGRFSGTVVIGAFTLTSMLSGDIIVMKSDPSGNVLWAKKFTGSGSDNANSISLDNNGNIIISGYIGTNQTIFDSYTLTANGNSDYYVCKMNSSGSVTWVKQFSSPDQFVINKSVVDPSGNIFVAGNFQNTAILDTYTLTSAGLTDAFLAKIDGSGNTQLFKKFGGSDAENAQGISIENSGNIYLTGKFRSSVVLGTGTLTSIGSYDGFLVKCDGSANVLWAKQFGGSGNDEGREVACEIGGNIFLAAEVGPVSYVDTYTLNTALAFISKFTSSGNPVWVKELGCDVGFLITSIVVDPASNLYMAGSFGGSFVCAPGLVSGDTEDGFISKLDANGIFVWTKHLGGSGLEDFNSCTYNTSGKIYVAGSFAGPSMIDTYTYTTPAPDTYQSLTLKIDPALIGLEENQQDSEFSIYPNPASDKLYIDVKEPGKSANLCLTNVLGQELINKKSIQSEVIDVSFFPRGIYFLRLCTEESHYLKKVVLAW